MPHPRRAAFVGALPLALLAALAGCATGTGAAAGPGTADNVHNTQLSLNMTVYREPGRATHALPAPVERVRTHVAVVYQEMGIPVTSTDPAAKVVVAAGQRLRTVDGRRIGAFFDCGGGFGNAASAYQVIVTARTELVADAAGGSVARTAVEASARAPASGTRVSCNSTGLLERTIGERLAARTASDG